MHSTEYRENYKVNLEGALPRIPMLKDFERWAAWEKELMDLHINYANIEKYKLERIEKDKDNTSSSETKLKADKKLGRIIIDD